MFTVNKGINRVHELIDIVQWGAPKRPFARRLRKLELQKPPGDLTVSHRLLAVSSVIRNHCFGADGATGRLVYDRNNGANELTPPRLSDHDCDDDDVADQWS